MLSLLLLLLLLLLLMLLLGESLLVLLLEEHIRVHASSCRVHPTHPLHLRIHPTTATTIPTNTNTRIPQLLLPLHQKQLSLVLRHSLQLNHLLRVQAQIRSDSEEIIILVLVRMTTTTHSSSSPSTSTANATTDITWAVMAERKPSGRSRPVWRMMRHG